MNKKELKEECIKLYLSGKNYTEIARLTGFSRTFITNLIKDDERIIQEKNNKIIKVHKRKKDKRMVIYIPTKLIKKLGISEDLDKEEFVNIVFDEASNNLIILKHNK